jgi:hypothetical protein
MGGGTPKTYAVLFVGWGSHDWMGQVVEDERGVRVAHRFRFYDPIPRANDVWDGVDQKQWFESTTPDMTVQTGISAVRMLMRKAVVAGVLAGLPPPQVVDEVIEETGDQTRLVSELKTRDWCHCREFDTKEEADRFVAGRRPS